MCGSDTETNRILEENPSMAQNRSGDDLNQAIQSKLAGKEKKRNFEVFKIAKQILMIIFENRRLLTEEQNSPTDFKLETEHHIQKLIPKIKQSSPIELILPAFPAKSPNRRKTLGSLPDLAEKQALYNLEILCKKIKAIYIPGAKITICSDGRVFSDLVRIPDIDVTAYGQYLREYANAHHTNTFNFINLDDVYGGIKDFDTLREELLINYGESLVSLRQRCKTEKEARAVYRGISRFMFEDFLGLEPFRGQSRTSIQKAARIVAYRVIQRSNAWTRLLEELFSDAIRLSIHPQFRVSKKIGIHLVDTKDEWLTPWHSVAVKGNGKIVLRKRAEAETNSMLAFENGIPSHYELISDVNENTDSINKVVQ